MSYKTCVCNFCGTGCGQFLKTDGKSVIGVAPMKSHPVSKGKLCIRGWHVNELLKSSSRITKPMIRENGVLREVSYDEAIDYTALQLAKYKLPHREIGVMASARSSNEDSFILGKLANEAIKTGISGIRSDSGHRHSMESIRSTFGYPGAVGKLTAIDKTDYILIIGTDITRQNPIIGGNIHYARQRGARVVTICSTKTQIAELSDKHFQQQPGNKGLLVSALAKALYGVRSVNRTIPEDIINTTGFADYAETLRTISSVMLEKASGISYEEIEAEALHLAKAQSVVILFSSGISGLDRKTIDSITNLALLTGKMYHLNSALIPVTGISNLQGAYDMGLVAKDREDAIFNCLKDKSSLLKAILLVDHDDGVTRYRDRLKQLEFIVYIGSFQNPIMDLANIILPITSFNESDGTFTCTDRRVQLIRQITEPSADVLPAWKLYEKIANKLGCKWNLVSAENIFEQLRKEIPSYVDLNYERLERNFGAYWKPEAYPQKRQFNNIFISYPEVHTSASFPFALMVGKAQHYWHQNNLMRKTLIPRREYDAMLLLYPKGYIEICPEDAKLLNVRDKWLVRVSNREGHGMDIAVRVSESVQRGTAYVPYFIKNQIFDFLEANDEAIIAGEESIVPIRIEDMSRR